MSVSPDKKWLAAGSHIYSTDEWKLMGTCKGNFTAVDWSSDSKFLRSNCSENELKFWSMPDCKQDEGGEEMKWASKTVKVSWHTQGIFPKGAVINSVAGSDNGKLLATGDDFGLIRLFNDPCLQSHKPRTFQGHSSQVLSVLFHKEYLFSVGGAD